MMTDDEKSKEILRLETEIARLKMKMGAWARAFRVRKVDKEWGALDSVLKDMERESSK